MGRLDETCSKRGSPFRSIYPMSYFRSWNKGLPPKNCTSNFHYKWIRSFSFMKISIKTLHMNCRSNYDSKHGADDKQEVREIPKKLLSQNSRP